jgi:tRNA threonylcarbamoyladenosine biosynthesis protein TsaB
MAYGVISKSVLPDFIYCPMIDARRMEVYCSLLNHRMEVLKETRAEIIDTDSFADLLSDQKIIFFGDGSDKCAEVITSPNAFFIKDAYPEAKSIGYLANDKMMKGEFEDVAYFEPFYLKDFVSTSKK